MTIKRRQTVLTPVPDSFDSALLLLMLSEFMVEYITFRRACTAGDTDTAKDMLRSMDNRVMPIADEMRRYNAWCDAISAQQDQEDIADAYERDALQTVKATKH